MPDHWEGQVRGPCRGDATWKHSFSPGSNWTTLGGDFAAAASGSASVGTTLTSYAWSSTPGMIADVQHWLDNPAQDFGWAVLGQEESQKSARQFGSRENVVPGLRPTLTIEYEASVPEPGTAVLALLASLGMVGIGRRRKS